MKKPRLEEMSPKDLTLNKKVQVRLKMSDDAVADYTEAIENEGGWPFEPVDVFHTEDDTYLVADGFHRVTAALAAKLEYIPCRIREGGEQDAKIFGMTANDSQGLRLTHADKVACIQWLLKVHKGQELAKIAELAGVAYRTVQRIAAAQRAKTDTKTQAGRPSAKKSIPAYEPPEPDEGPEEGPGDIRDPEPAEKPAKKPDPKPEQKPEQKHQASIVNDALDRPVPAEFREAHQLGMQLLSIGREIDKIRKTAKELIGVPGGEWLVEQSIDEAVRILKNQFTGARYHSLCPDCEGSKVWNDAPCKKCAGIGWLPEFHKGLFNK